MKMNDEKKAFLMYSDYEEHFSLLSLEDRGTLITAIFEYNRTRVMPELQGMVKMAFSFIKLVLDRDANKWDEKKVKRSEAGKKGGAPKGNSNAQKQAKTTKNKQNKLLMIMLMLMLMLMIMLMLMLMILISVINHTISLHPKILGLRLVSLLSRFL